MILVCGSTLQAAVCGRGGRERAAGRLGRPCGGDAGGAAGAAADGGGGGG